MTADQTDENLRRERLVFYEDDIEDIDGVLQAFLEKSKATSALLIDIDGHLVTKQGFTGSLDTESIAALVAGSFASTRAMAKHLGEKEFSVIFHEGEEQSIQISLAHRRCLIVVIFDDRTTIGMIRLHAKEAADRLGEILSAIETKGDRPSPLNDGTFQAEAENALDSFFGDD